ncbi:MAG: hypothetical protein LBD46_01410, partial [Endomicrobium sp.]|nr:hypothetical protein [Endomicrobium sp.]
MFNFLKRGIFTALFTIFVLATSKAAAINVNDWNDLYLAISTHSTSIYFTTSVINYTGILPQINYGGVVYFNNETTLISTSTTISELLNFSSSAAVFSSSMTFTNSGGGAIYAENGSNITFDGSTMTFTSNNTNKITGKGIIHLTAHSTVTFTNSSINFINNLTDQRGMITVDASDIIINMSTVNFRNSRVGGGIFGENSSNINITNSVINFNGRRTTTESVGDGGGLHVRSGSTATFDNSSVTFTDNFTPQHGGAIFNYNGTINFNDNYKLEFINNYSSDGGAIYNGGELTINGYVLFSQNINNAIYNMEKSTFTINGSAEFNGNYIQKSESRGAAIYNKGTVNLNAVNGSSITFMNNNATEGRDIYGSVANTYSSLININGEGDVVFYGGIEGDGSITKTNTGNVYFKAGSKTDFKGTFNINGGIVNFSTSAYINHLNIGDGTIGIDTDFSAALGTGTGFILTTTTTLIGNSKLYVNETGTNPSVVGSSTAIIFANSHNMAFSRANISSAGDYGYRFIWINDNLLSGYSYTGWLIYGADPWNSFVSQFKSSGTTSGIYLAAYIKAEDEDENPFNEPLSNNFIVGGFDGNMQIIDSAFKDNKGFILNTKTITFQDLTFQYFVSTSSGGVISAHGNSNINLAGNTVDFKNNRAVNGGAVYLSGSGITVASSSYITAKDNVAVSSGGFLFSTGNKNINIDLERFNLSNNLAGIGGTFYGENGTTFTFTTSAANISNSSASHAGGYIALGSGGYADFSAALLNISSNIAGNYGGFMYLNGAEAVFGKTDFINNTAQTGGALYLIYGSTAAFEASDINFIRNNATGGAGGAIYNNNSTINFDRGRVSFTSNSSTEGGAIYNASGNVNFTSSTVNFTSNNANYYGGAIYASGNNVFVNFMFSTTNFTNNRADRNGGAIYNDNRAVLSFTSSTVSFTSNTATKEGGAIDNVNNSSINFIDSTVNFIDNITQGNGGAIVNYFQSNNNDRSIIKFMSSEVKFSGNISEKEGGAIYNTNGASLNFTSSNIYFTSNTAKINGGSISNNSTNSIINLMFSTVTFTGNIANSSGGAIYNRGNKDATYLDFTLSTLRFMDNSAYYGGAIYNDSAKINFTDSDVNFAGNSAEYGGAIYNNSNATINFSGSTLTFTGNIAASSGGAIFLKDGDADFEKANLTVRENKVNAINGAGGFLYAEKAGNINFGNVEAVNNEASSGGAIYSNNSTINFTSGIVNFTSNNANDGGAIYNNSTNIFFTNSKVNFTNNHAKNSGGAIYVNGNSSINFEDSHITATGNIAISSGGFLFSSAQTNIEIDLDKIY